MAPLWVLAVLVLLAESYFAGAVLIPLVISLFLALLLDPLVVRAQRLGVPRPLGACVVVLGFFVVTTAAGWACARPFSRLLQDLPLYSLRIRSATSAVERQTRRMQKSAESVEGARTLADPEIPRVQVVEGDEKWTSILWRGVGSIFELAGIAVFIPFLVVFALCEKDLLSRAAAAVLGPECDLAAVAAETARMSRAYFVGNLALGLALAFVQWLLFALLGLENAVGLGLLTGFITTIPIVGLPGALLLPAAQCLLQFHQPLPLVVLIAALTALHFLAASLIGPRVIGARVKMNATAATAALLFWGWLWGIAGFLLAVPLTALIKILLESTEDTLPLSRLLADRRPALPSRVPRVVVAR
jgi:predicted PurR-regulated permease PerM